MDEFLKLDWRKKDLEKILPPNVFISDEEISKSNIFKSFERNIKPLTIKKGKSKKGANAKKFTPGLDFFAPIKLRSLLKKQQKEHCLKALKILQSGTNLSTLTQAEKYSVKTYNACHKLILQENQQFLDWVKKRWDNNKGNTIKLRPAVKKFAEFFWQQNCKNIEKLPQFYAEHSVIALNYDETESSVHYENTQIALEIGTVARFAVPNLKSACTLRLNTLPPMKIEEINSKFPISLDKNIERILNGDEKNKFDVAISSSALKQILDNSDGKNNWYIPFTVRQIGGRKIVLIDKVLPKINPHCYDFKQFVYKKLLKANFCEYEAFRFENEDLPVRDETRVEDEPTDENQSKSKTIHHNVSYRIWNIKATNNFTTLMKQKVDSPEINLLVRCKLDACEKIADSALQPVIIKPKMEFQLQYGANMPTKSELAREWTSLFFRPFSNLYRARLHHGTAEIVSVEKCTLQKINTEALNFYSFKPHLGLGVLQKVLQELLKLDNGNYLLHHNPKNENFVAILKETSQCANSFNLHDEYKQCRMNTNSIKNWTPIDVNYILPAHEDLEKLPGVFEVFMSKSTKRPHQLGAKSGCAKKTTKRSL